MSILPLFHLAFPVTDLEGTRVFFRDILECQIGRESERWIDFDFGGHQITAHLVDKLPTVSTNPVDGKQVPASHFGLIMEWDAWHRLAERMKKANCKFIIEPYIRFKGLPGEQATMFVVDPSGNCLEFKSFREMTALWAKQ